MEAAGARRAYWAEMGNFIMPSAAFPTASSATAARQQQTKTRHGGRSAGLFQRTQNNQEIWTYADESSNYSITTTERRRPTTRRAARQFSGWLMVTAAYSTSTLVADSSGHLPFWKWAVRGPEQYRHPMRQHQQQQWRQCHRLFQHQPPDQPAGIRLSSALLGQNLKLTAICDDCRQRTTAPPWSNPPAPNAAARSAMKSTRGRDGRGRRNRARHRAAISPARARMVMMASPARRRHHRRSVDRGLGDSEIKVMFSGDGMCGVMFTHPAEHRDRLLKWLTQLARASRRKDGRDRSRGRGSGARAAARRGHRQFPQCRRRPSAAPAPGQSRWPGAAAPHDLRSLLSGIALRHCKAPVRWQDNIPFLSFLLLRGHCRACGHGFGAKYLLLERAALPPEH